MKKSKAIGFGYAPTEIEKISVPELIRLHNGSGLPGGGILSGLYTHLDKLKTEIDHAGLSGGFIFALGSSTSRRVKLAAYWARANNGFAGGWREFSKMAKCDPVAVSQTWKALGYDIVDDWFNDVGWWFRLNISKMNLQNAYGLVDQLEDADRIAEIFSEQYEDHRNVVVMSVHIVAKLEKD